MIRLAIFNALLLGCCGYAFLRGAGPERIGAAIVLIGSYLTLAAFSTSAHAFKTIELGIFIVDVVCLAALLLLALRAERYWPFWVAALQIIGTAAHAIRWVDPQLTPRGYAFLLAVGSYPMLLMIAVGTLRHQRRLAQFGLDNSWSPRRRSTLAVG